MHTLNMVASIFGYLILILLVMGFLMMIYELMMERYRQRNMDYLDTLYAEVWNGTDEDRIYAWFRVIEHMKCWNFDEDLIAKAKQRLELLKRERSKKVYISKEGKLIEKTEIR